MTDAAGILLQAGTNEMELLVFRINTIHFGINVAKVREIIQRVDIWPATTTFTDQRQLHLPIY